MHQINNRKIILTLAALLGAYFLYTISEILGPFIAGGVLAFFFQPLISKLKTFGVPRWGSSLLVTCLILTIIAVFFWLVLPKVYTQALKLIVALPKYTRQLQEMLNEYLVRIGKHVDPQYIVVLKNKIGQTSNYLLSTLNNSFSRVLNGSISMLHTLGMIIVSPIIAFYLMKDWPNMVASIDRYLPPNQKRIFYYGLAKINASVGSYLRGQSIVCVVIMFLYTIMFYFIGLQYSLIMGVVAGALTFVPYAGVTIAYISAMLLAYLQGGGSSLYIGVTVAVLVAQTLEMALLSPYLIGKRLGLHPIWVLFAIFLGGYIFGFWGVLLATPIAGVLRTILPSLYNVYVKSEVSRDDQTP